MDCLCLQVKSNSLLTTESAPSATPPPQEVNGTNGTAAFPETQRPPERSEHSTDTDEGEGGATEDPGGTSTFTGFTRLEIRTIVLLAVKSYLTKHIYNKH